MKRNPKSRLIRMGRRKKSKLKPRSVDRISDLPDGVVLHVLSFLETRDAVRTSVLSRRWQFLWKHVPNLVLNFTNGSMDKPQMRSLYGTLFHHAAPKILKFSLHLDGAWPLRRVKRLVSFAAERHVEELVICLTGMCHTYILPHCIFSCHSLRKLRLRCTVRPPERVSWGSLRVLHVEFGGLEDIVEVLSGCPSLESLTLHSVCLSAPAPVHIVHYKMKTLLVDHLYKNFKEKLEVNVTAPRLEKLKFSGVWHGIICKLIDVRSLVNVHLDFILDLEDVDTDPRMEIFQTVGHSKTLCLGMDFMKILAEREMIKLCPALYSKDCMVLKMQVRLGDLEQWILGMFSLIHHSPNLARLIVDFQDYKWLYQLHLTNDVIAYEVCSPAHDGVTYTPDNGLEDWKSITRTNSFLSNVKIVEIHGMVGKYHWFKFVEMLLKELVALEKMIIFSKPFDAASVTEVAETLSTCQRSSPHVMVSFQEG